MKYILLIVFSIFFFSCNSEKTENKNVKDSLDQARNNEIKQKEIDSLRAENNKLNDKLTQIEKEMSANNISDETIISQVQKYLEKDTRDAGFGTAHFNDDFEILNISVSDKMLKEKECTAICNLTLKTKKMYQENSGITYAYGFIVGDSGRNEGSKINSEAKFLFEKYEKGWLIKKEIK